MRIEIFLPAALGKQHQRAVERYSRGARLSPVEWKLLLEAFDLLTQARIRAGDKVRTFKDVYQTVVPESVVADFLSHLLKLVDPEREGIPLKAAYARAVTERLLKSRWYAPEVAYSLYLRAYCMYWWDSFAKGYIFEVAVYRDLQDSGITFAAHDITDSSQRRSMFDLLVSDWRGDIKTSTYFLATARTRVLRHDFYITRLYDSQQRRRVRAVIMQPRIWTAINGETKAADLSQAQRRFPSVSHFDHRNHRLVVAAYAVWKAKVLAYQQEIE